MDPIAIWGAVTGTIACGIGVRREILARRQRLAVNHGWRYLRDPSNPHRLIDMHVYVIVQNIGYRNVPIMHVGWEWIQELGPDADGQDHVAPRRAELPLEAPVLVEPDGIPPKFDVPIGQLLHLVDPLEQLVRPVAFSHGGNVRWEGQWGVLAQNPPSFVSDEDLAALFARLKAKATPPVGATDSNTVGLQPPWIDLGGDGSPK